jgi:hypothetical protein
MQNIENSQYVCAEWDYEAIENNELTFKTGDYIKIVSKENDDWWEGILNGFQGFFPANRVREVTPQETEIVNESIKSRRSTLQSTNNLEIATPTIDTNNDTNYAGAMEEPIPQMSPTSDANPYENFENLSSPNQDSPDEERIDMSSLVNNQLPENWVTEYDDASGKYYYRNVITNETSWEFPVYNANLEEYEKDLPIGWKAGFSEGVIYYYNEFTNESSWEKPKKSDEQDSIKQDNDSVVATSTNNKIQIDLPAKKFRKSGDLGVRYESPYEKNHWKQCFVILCGSILLIYKKFNGSLSEQLPVKYVSIKNCQVEKSKKKKNVVNITSSTNEILTFTCNNESDSNSWVEEIKRYSVNTGDEEQDNDSDIIDMLEREYAKIDGGSKKKPKKPIQVDNNEEKPTKQSKKTFGIKFTKKFTSQNNLLSEYNVFGGSLEEQVQRDGSNIPKIVEDCIREIEKRGIETEGIYRLSGNTSVVNRLKAQYNKGETINFDDDEIDIPVLSSLLKSYFRELKDTVIPSCMYESFLEALRIDDEGQRLQQFYELIHDLPKVNYDVLSFLMNHLKKVSEESSQNKMAINNLAIVFGPTLIARTTDKNLLATTIIRDTPYQNRLNDIIITYEDYFFQTPPEDDI